MDGVSWRVLLEDLASALSQLALGESVSLPPKTTSFQQWSQRLVVQEASSSLRAQIGYWEGVFGSPAFRLPMDDPSGANISASQGTVRVSLDVEETRTLLSELPAVYHTQINDLLLTALAQSLKAWTGERRVLVDLEGHGREALFEDLDVSRTVGWFTSLYPLLLELPVSDNPGECHQEHKGNVARGSQPGYGLWAAPIFE